MDSPFDLGRDYTLALEAVASVAVFHKQRLVGRDSVDLDTDSVHQEDMGILGLVDHTALVRKILLDFGCSLFKLVKSTENTRLLPREYISI